MSWKWEDAFGAEQSSRTLPRYVLDEVKAKADELVRACEAKYPSARAFQDVDPPGGNVNLPSGGFFRYQIVVRQERVYVVQITTLDV